MKTMYVHDGMTRIVAASSGGTARVTRAEETLADKRRDRSVQGAAVTGQLSATYSR